MPGMVPDRDALRRLLRARGWRLYDLAEKARVSKSTIDNIFGKDGHRIFPSTQKRLATALGVPVSAVVVDDENHSAGAGESAEATTKEAERKTMINLARMPASGGAVLVGRDAELEAMERAWGEKRTRILALVGAGGMGKTALVNRWIGLGGDKNRGAERIFAWSFHGQGLEGYRSASDAFFSEALAWFGDPCPDDGEWYSKAHRLATRLREARTLLILDGLEVLLSGENEGYFPDQEPVLALLQDLTQEFSGLVLLSSRVAPRELSGIGAGVFEQISIEGLPVEQGVSLLRESGVEGCEVSLSRKVEMLWGHPLSLALLGEVGLSALQDESVPELVADDIWAADGVTGRRIAHLVDRYEALLDPRKRAILYVLALFDDLIRQDLLEQFCLELSGTQLAEALFGIPRTVLRVLINDMREHSPLGRSKDGGVEYIDLHPLIRRAIREKLQKGFAEEYREVQRRI